MYFPDIGIPSIVTRPVGNRNAIHASTKFFQSDNLQILSIIPQLSDESISTRGFFRRTQIIESMSEPATLVELLQHRARIQPNKLAYTFLIDGETEEVRFTYAQLDRRARAIATRIWEVATNGDRALLLYPAGLEFIAAFFGCLYAGVIAVPTYPPRRNRPDPRFEAIAEDANASIVLTTTEILSNASSRPMKTQILRDAHWLATDEQNIETSPAWEIPDIWGDTLAFLQYTSGSTGSPKGVMVNHHNILYNEEMVRWGFGHTEETIFVGWLPLFHDMGLIGNVLQPLYLGIPCTLLSPVAFLQRPVRWLQAISRYRATTSGGPNFAYDLCIEKTTPDERAKLDLHCWEVAYNGAEPIRAETLERFSKTFASSGFREKAFYPTYGMAETTLFVSGSRSRKPVIHEIEEEENRGLVARSSGKKQRLVGCGRATWLEQKVVITDPDSLTPRLNGEVGEIWVSGDNVAQGYWNRPEETRKTFEAHLDSGEGPFLRTGDLGFLKDGQLFITGRLKDLIIIHAQNYYPQDIELAVERSHEALNPNGCAAFSVEEEHGEQLVIVQEARRTWLRKLDTDAVFEIIRQAVFEQHELPIHAILLLKPGHLPKTSSGKVQRRACRTRFLAGELEAVAEWRQPEVKEITPSKGIPSPSDVTKDLIRNWLIDRIARSTDIPPAEIDTGRLFTDYGLDSIAAVGLSEELGKWLGQSLPPTIPYEYPTIDALARHLAGLRTGHPTTRERNTAREIENKNETEEIFPFFTPDFNASK
uniref:Acyl-CoA synthetase (AMP-forming)/AMP-acid ligase II n=1 Tax=Candidatus Kentrum sp. TC TaxID=2126339 RepID=A0A450YYS5_9GAMM|nr:MAG: Acyl-CoA synthetase (AMP-forming)/AMP-acid ligase II [Candidatus Kentron sp. TC]